MNSCLNCHKETTFKKYCSRTCSSTFTNKLRKPRTIESKLKTSLSISRLHSITPSVGPSPRTRVYFRICSNCRTNFVSTHTKKLTCSIECRDAIRSKNGTLKRRIQYKSFIFQSNWEVEIAKFLDDNLINWSQPVNRLRWFDTTLKKNRTYLPDFYLTDFDFFIDVKNPYKQQQDADKISQLKSHINLFVGDIKQVIQFVDDLRGLEPPTISSTTFEA